MLKINAPNVTMNGLNMYTKFLGTVSKPYYYGNKSFADVLK